MSSDGCARCGRDRTISEYGVDGSAPGMHWPAPNAPYDAWLWVEGQDICPRCQTADERRDAEQRIATAVEREVERRSSAGIPPDPYEPPIVERAMDIRAGSEADAREGDIESRPEHAHEAVDDADRVRLRVAVTGAFLTGHPLTVRLDDYGDLQRKLGDRLRGPQWLTDGLHGGIELAGF